MSTFTQGSLPDAQKEALCRDLLAEFGATNVKMRKDELLHGCLLPWAKHTDQAKNPTASLNWDKLTYKCLGCGAGGGLLWFIASCRGTSGHEARAWLNGATGMDGQVLALTGLLEFFDAIYKPKSGREPIATYSDRILAPWMLIHPYMTEIRKVPEETILRFKVGYAEDYVVARDAETGKVLKTSERIVIPHYFNDSLVGWQTRRLYDDGTPKYLSSPEFPKDQTIYNHGRRRCAIVVESPMSVLNKFHVLPDMVATFGMNVTDDQVRLLSKYDEVIIWPDNDTAGWNGVEGEKTINPKTGYIKQVSEGLAPRLMPFTNVKVVDSPYAGDPCNVDDTTAVNLVAEAVPFSIWSRPLTLKQFEEV